MGFSYVLSLVLIVSLLTPCVCELLLPKTVSKGSGNSTITATFSDEVDVYEDKLLASRISRIISIKNSPSQPVFLSRNSGFVVSIEIFNVQLDPKYVPLDRTGENDNNYLLN